MNNLLMMEGRFVKNATFVKLLVLNSNLNLRRKLIKHASPQQLYALFEIIGNIIFGKIQCSKQILDSVKSKKKIFLTLWKKGVTLNKKRELLNENLTSVIKLVNGCKDFLECF